MIRITAILILSLVLQNARAQNKVVVQVSNFENNKGVCRACLFNSSEAFNGEGRPVQCLQVPVNGNSTQVVFDNVPEGTYAVSVFHDANNNNKFDKNFLGIPKEGYGASRNKLPFASAPGFNDNKFVAGPGITRISIKLRNL